MLEDSRLACYNVNEYKERYPMTKRLKSILVTFAALSIAVLPCAMAVPALAVPPNIKDQLCSGTIFDVSGGCTNCGANTSANDFNALLTKIVNIFSAIVGVIAVIMIIVGGLRYITSGGDSSHV